MGDLGEGEEEEEGGGAGVGMGDVLGVWSPLMSQWVELQERERERENEGK